MQKWEYCTLTINYAATSYDIHFLRADGAHRHTNALDTVNYHKEFAALGMDGWELVGITEVPGIYATHYFKRPIAG